MADETTSNDKKGKRKSGKGKLLLVGVLLAGAAGGYFLKGGGTEEPAAGATATTAPPEPGTMIELEPLSLNLADDRYLRVGVAVQLVKGEGGGHGGGAEEWLAENGPIIRDLLIQQYGPERGRKIEYVEAFEPCEYGSELDEAARARLFSFAK